MVDYNRLIATAQRLLQKNGRQITLLQIDNTPSDPAKPWTAPGDPFASPTAQLTVWAVQVPSSGSGLGLNLSTLDFLKRSDKIFLTSPGAMADVTLYTHVLDGGDRFVVEGIEVLRPAAGVVLAVVGARS